MHEVAVSIPGLGSHVHSSPCTGSFCPAVMESNAKLVLVRHKLCHNGTTMPVISEPSPLCPLFLLQGVACSAQYVERCELTSALVMSAWLGCRPAGNDSCLQIASQLTASAAVSRCKHQDKLQAALPCRSQPAQKPYLCCILTPDHASLQPLL